MNVWSCLLCQITANIESLHANIHQLFEIVIKDAENIRALAHIAEIHHARLTALEGGGANA